MLIIREGDLLQSLCTVIAHQSNCFGVMSAGIAKQIAAKYPEVLRADREFSIPVGSRERLGRFSVAEVYDPAVGRRLVFNLYGQYRFGRGKRHTEVKQLESAVRGMMAYLQANEDSAWVRVGLPYGIGAGLGGGDWEEIRTMLEHCSEEFGMEIELYRLNRDRKGDGSS
jgi:O-acetyl-ADP-ribose deacetylase (regulator of RNase III)